MSAPENARVGRRRRADRRGPDPIPMWLGIVGALVAMYFVLPTFVVIPMSFSAGNSFQFPPKELSLHLYERFFTDPTWTRSLGNSILVALGSMVVATVVGTAAAIGLHFSAARWVQWVRSLLMLPLVAPGIVIAVFVYISFLQWRISGNYWGYLLAHSALAIPFVLITVSSSLGGFDARLLRASTSLGANAWRGFVTVMLPLISRGIVTGAIIAFVTSFDEVVAALFLRSPSFQTLPVKMYTSVTVEIDPTVAAASSLIIVAVTLIFLLPLIRPRRGA